MKVSEISIKDIAEYLRLDYTEADTTTNTTLEAIFTVAKKYISDYTGIPENADNPEEETIDSHEDFWIVVMVLCQDMYDNRSMYVDKSNINRVVETILGMHCRNLL